MSNLFGFPIDLNSLECIEAGKSYGAKLIYSEELKSYYWTIIESGSGSGTGTDKDEQTLSLEGNKLSISNGNHVMIHPAANLYVNNNPALRFNENLQKIGLDLTIAGSYNNANSGLNADNIQGAIDELASSSKHKYVEVISPTPNEAYTITHNLNDKDVIVQAYSTDTEKLVDVEVERIDINNIKITSTTNDDIRIIILS